MWSVTEENLRDKTTKFVYISKEEELKTILREIIDRKPDNIDANIKLDVMTKKLSQQGELAIKTNLTRSNIIYLNGLPKIM